MDNNSESLGTDPEVQVAPQTTNEPAPLVFDPTATLVIRDIELVGDFVETDAVTVYNEFRTSKNRLNELVVKRQQIRNLESYLESAVADTSDDERIEMLKEIAEIFDIELKRTVTVTATVQHTFEIELEFGADLPDKYDFDFSVESSEYELENENADITNFSVDED
jgi:hypothetical protein